MPQPVDVIVVTYNSARFIEQCISCLLASVGVDVNVVVVDNDSADDTLAIVRRQFPSVRCIASEDNVGYAAALNLGLSVTSNPVCFLSNPDVIVPKESIAALARYLDASPRTAVVGPQQYFPDGTFQRSFGLVPGIVESLANLFYLEAIWNRALARGLWNHRARPTKVGYVDGAFMAVRRSAIVQVGGFDSNFFFYSEEADFCLRVQRLGWRVETHPSVPVFHVRGASSRRVDSTGLFDRLYVESRARLAKKRYGRAGYLTYLVLELLRAEEHRLAHSLLRSVSNEESMARIARHWRRLIAEASRQ